MINNENTNDLNVVELDAESLEEISGGKDAGQKIKATGNANVRKGPGLNYDSMGVLESGDKLTFLGIAKKDDRGVAWFKVSFHGKTGWISSRYAKVL